MYNLQNTIDYLKNSIKNAILNAIKNNNLPKEIIPEFDIEIPGERDHGDLSTNVALISAKKFKMSPKKIAEITILTIGHFNDTISSCYSMLLV